MNAFTCTITKKPPFDINKLNKETLTHASRDMTSLERTPNQHPMCVAISSIIFSHDSAECENEIHPIRDLNRSHICHGILKNLYKAHTWINKPKTADDWIIRLLSKQYPRPSYLKLVD
jgi:hypothetical protein